MNYPEAQKALDRTKIALMNKKDSTFFITVCFSLRHLWDETIPTAGTDGECIWYNPEFFLSLSEEERLFLLLHETLHTVFMHITRLKKRDRKRWNYAGDYVINYLLVSRGYKMPDGGLYDTQYKDMTTEQVYDLLKPEDISAGFIPDIHEPSQDAQVAQAKLDDILVRAAVQAQLAGDRPDGIPGEVQLYLNELLDPKLPWYQILRRFMGRMVKTDYSFRKPNKRHFPDVILPTQHSEGLVDIAVAVDTSGSITDKQFTQFVSEAYAILKQHKPNELKLIQFDWKIQAINDLNKPEDLMNIKFTGRGGTRIDPVIEWAEENKPNVLIIFTDGFFRNHKADPKVPIIWIVHSNPGYYASYGRVINYNLD